MFIKDFWQYLFICLFLFVWLTIAFGHTLSFILRVVLGGGPVHLKKKWVFFGSLHFLFCIGVLAILLNYLVFSEDFHDTPGLVPMIGFYFASPLSLIITLPVMSLMWRSVKASDLKASEIPLGAIIKKYLIKYRITITASFEIVILFIGLFFNRALQELDDVHEELEQLCLGIKEGDAVSKVIVTVEQYPKLQFIYYTHQPEEGLRINIFNVSKSHRSRMCQVYYDSDKVLKTVY